MGEHDVDQLYLHLKGARERLCLAQMLVPAHWRADIDALVMEVDTIGSACCPEQWSQFDQPEYPRGRADA